jgi:heptosyltransferase-1
MRVLIIKTSSLGDVIHTLPALTDAGKNIPDIRFDWVLEPAFAEIPCFHPLVENTILSPLRYFRRNIIQSFKKRELQEFYQKLRAKKYDMIIDAQGLMKSGFLTLLAEGKVKCGYDRRSAWEPLACIAYHQKFNVNPTLHAITRIRKLFSYALQYADPSETQKPDYHIRDHVLKLLKTEQRPSNKDTIVFLHGTTRDDKLWPVNYWIKLKELLLQHTHCKILLPWGNEIEKQCADHIAMGTDRESIQVLPKSSISDLTKILAASKLNIAVDTGLGHLSAALNSPTISLYAPTDPKLIGTVGENQTHLKSDSHFMKDILPEQVLEAIHFTLTSNSPALYR